MFTLTGRKGKVISSVFCLANTVDNGVGKWRFPQKRWGVTLGANLLLVFWQSILKPATAGTR